MELVSSSQNNNMHRYSHVNHKKLSYLQAKQPGHKYFHVCLGKFMQSGKVKFLSANSDMSTCRTSIIQSEHKKITGLITNNTMWQHKNQSGLITNKLMHEREILSGLIANKSFLAQKLKQITNNTIYEHSNQNSQITDNTICEHKNQIGLVT